MNVRRWWSAAVALFGLFLGWVVINMSMSLDDALRGQPAVVRQSDSPDPWWWVAEAVCAALFLGGTLFAVFPSPIRRQRR